MWFSEYIQTYLKQFQYPGTLIIRTSADVHHILQHFLRALSLSLIPTVRIRVRPPISASGTVQLPRNTNADCVTFFPFFQPVPPFLWS